MTIDAGNESNAAATGTVDFNYQKSPDYRSIHVDGAVASTTPKGYAAITFYNERGVLPRLTRRPVIAQPTDLALTLGEEESIDSLSDVMRQLETTIFINLTTAVEMRDLFDRLVDGLKAQVSAQSAAESSESE